MVGDIVLTRSRGRWSLCVLAAQKLRRWDFSTPGYTHVALLLGNHRAIHAMKRPDSVELTVIHELLAPDSRWTVWRHQGLSEKLAKDEDSAISFAWNAECHLGKRYNRPPTLRRREHYSFCSELVAEVFAGAGYPFPGRPHKLTPLDIAGLVSNPSESQWVEVTSEYRERLLADKLYGTLYFHPEPRFRELERAALQSAKKDSRVYGDWTEAIEGIVRFDHWAVERGADGWDVWRYARVDKTPQAHGSRAYWEWTSLLVNDEIVEEMISLMMGEGAFQEDGRATDA